MSDCTAGIRAKGLDTTGVTEQLAAKMYNNVGGHYLAIVDLRVAFHGEDDDGNRKVTLVIDQIEPVIDGKLNGALVEHVRQINAALHRNRMLAENGPQLPIDGQDVEPTVEQVLAARAGLIGTDDKGEPILLEDDPDEDDETPPAGDWDYPASEGHDVKPITTIDDPFTAHHNEVEPATT